jgi:ferritin
MKKKYQLLFGLLSIFPLMAQPLYAESAASQATIQPLLNSVMNKELADSLIKQVSEEFTSAETYLEKISYFESKGLTGFSQYLRTHYFVEIDHGLTIFNYLVKRGIEYKMARPAVSKMPEQTPLAIFQKLLDDEIQGAKEFDRLTELARVNQDQATVLLLQKFAQIQVNEIYQIGRIVKRLRFAGNDTAAIFMIDQQLQHEIRAIGYIKFDGLVDENINRGEVISKEYDYRQNGVGGGYGAGGGYNAAHILAGGGS